MKSLPQLIFKILFFLVLFIRTLNSYAQDIPKQDMILGISKIWKEVSYNYIYYNEINFNWDSLYTSYVKKICTSNLTDDEYKHILEHFICSLHEGHSFINYTDNIKKYNYQIICTFDNKRIYVTGNSIKNANLLPIGTEITHINEIPILQYLDSLYNEYPIRYGIKYEILSEIFLYNNSDSVLNIDCLYPNNIVKKIRIYPPRELTNWNNYLYFYPLKNEIKIIADSILYVGIKDFSTADAFNNFIDSINLLKKSKGLIFDIRHNKGGSDFGYLIYKFFTNDSINNFVYNKKINDSFMSSKGAYANEDIMHFMGRNINHEYYEYYKSKYSWFDNTIVEKDSIQQKIGRCNYIYQKPIIILTDERTASASELFIIGLKNITTPTIIGSQTYGSAGQPLFIPINKNIIAQIASTSVICKGVEYSYTEPDITVKPTIKDFENKRDVVLEKGIEIIKAQLLTSGNKQ